MNRLIALDMLRGYALVCIMLDHMPKSALRSFTLANFSIFDAAELFVLLSGFLVGMVWQSVERRQGARAAQWRFARRAFEGSGPGPAGRGPVPLGLAGAGLRVAPVGVAGVRGAVDHDLSKDAAGLTGPRRDPGASTP